MKKVICILLCLIAIFTVSMPKIAYADMGPKESVHVNFIGATKQVYWATLLGRAGGPWSEYNGTNARYQEGDGEYTAWVKFVEFCSENGLVFEQFVEECTSVDKFSWTYYPPYEFQVLVYFPESDSFAISNQLHQYRFDSYFTVDLASSSESVIGEARVVSATESYDYFGEIMNLIIRIVLTIAVEIGVFFLFGLLKKKKLWQKLSIIAAVNFITQLALNVVMYYSNYVGYIVTIMFIFVISELVIMLLEGIIYSFAFVKLEGALEQNEKKRLRTSAFFYSVAANVTTWFLGGWLSSVIPAIF